MSPNAIMAVATSTQLLLPHAQGGDPHRDLGCRHVRREPAFARNRPKSPQTTPHSIRIDDHFRPTECLIAPVLFRSTCGPNGPGACLRPFSSWEKVIWSIAAF